MLNGPCELGDPGWWMDHGMDPRASYRSRRQDMNTLPTETVGTTHH